MTAGLAPGAPVRVKSLFPPGHVRTPYFLRGRRGRIVQLVGVFGDPEALAYGRRDAQQALYRVRFDQTELWPDYRGNKADTLIADLYDRWLEPLEGEAR